MITNATQRHGIMLENIYCHPIHTMLTEGNRLVLQINEVVPILKADASNYEVQDRWGNARIVPVSFIQPIQTLKDQVN